MKFAKNLENLKTRFLLDPWLGGGAFPIGNGALFPRGFQKNTFSANPYFPENRYGISRLEPKSYSGLLYKASLIGPIQMSIDVFPSHEIDVRICVQNLRKCQTQTIAPRSWNRISARIKVQSTEKVELKRYL